MIVKYNHHGWDVSVQEHLKGRHREHCLCFQNCENFKPGDGSNCEIAKKLYNLCVGYGLVTPVFECSRYSKLSEQGTK